MREIRAHGRVSFAALTLAVVAALVGLDLLSDAQAGGSLGHLVVELAVLLLTGLGALVLLQSLRAERRALREAALRAGQEAARWREEAVRWRAEAALSLRGLGEAIDRQFGRWQLSPAEREVALLLLKGLSLKEAAEVRGTSERTVRQQAQVVYQKAGLAGRAELQAFFLEDLLVGPARGAQSSSSSSSSSSSP